MARDGPQRHRKLVRNVLNMWFIWLEASAWLSLYTKAQYAILLHTAHYLWHVQTHDVSGNSCIPVLVDWLSETKEWQTYHGLFIVKPQLRAHAKQVSYKKKRILPPTAGVSGHHQAVTIKIVYFQT